MTVPPPDHETESSGVEASADSGARSRHRTRAPMTAAVKQENAVGSLVRFWQCSAQFPMNLRITRVVRCDNHQTELPLEDQNHHERVSSPLPGVTQQAGAKKLPEKERPRGAKDANLFRERLDAMTLACGRVDGGANQLTRVRECIVAAGELPCPTNRCEDFAPPARQNPTTCPVGDVTLPRGLHSGG